MKKNIIVAVFVKIFLLGTFFSTFAQISNNSHWESIPGLDGSVDVITASGNDLYVGGLFVTINGDSNASRIAKWNGTNWETLGSGLNDWCTSIAILGNDVYAGGSFTKASDQPNTSFIAKWDGTNWQTVGGGLNLHVSTLAVDGDTLYAGGAFRNAGGNPDADKIAKWNGTSWEAMDKGFNDWVYSIVIHNGDIYAGGNFISADQDTNVKFISKWNRLTSKWEPFGNGLNNTVQHIGFNGDDMYIGGFFTDAGGDTTADHIARWNGNSWEGLGAGLNGQNSEIQEFAFDGDNIYVVGNFTTVGEESDFNNVAKWNGTSWEKLGFGLNLETRSLAILGNDLYTGGSFTAEGPGGNQNINYLAKWKIDVTSITDRQNTAIQDFKLFQNYPNPFNPTTKIKYSIPNVRDADPHPLQVKLKVYDIIGREVATLVNEQKQPGTYEVEFNPAASIKNSASGVYFYRLKAGQFTQTKKLVFLK